MARYKYDSLNRLIREDNKPMNKTVLFSYDTAGNITERCEYAFTSREGEELTELACTHYSYDYEGDRLISYNGESIAYNVLGNPTSYRGNATEWQYGNRLTKYGTTTFAYDGAGRRVSKGNISFTYDSNGRLLKQSNGLEFVYDNSGVIGVKYNGNTYFYRRDCQGNIIAILDSVGNVVVEYKYDAWGNHEAEVASEDYVTLASLNPFRYRGYYYDSETGLYYLQTRYYDPETGRFISRDSIEYADPETICGLNLYAYCGNNPVMNVDPSGHIILSLIIAAVIGAAASALSSVMSQLLTTGTINWGQVGISALFGAVGGLLSFTGVGGVLGQFLIQGALGVGELYSISALNGTIDSVGIEAVVATFLFAGGVGSLGTGSAAAQFKRIGQIESSFIKYTLRDIKRYAKPILSTIVKRGGKYFKAFIAPTMRQAAISGGVNTIANIFDYWMQKLYEQW